MHVFKAGFSATMSDDMVVARRYQAAGYTVKIGQLTLCPPKRAQGVPSAKMRVKGQDPDRKLARRGPAAARGIAKGHQTGTAKRITSRV